jgi:hypothetical protein
MPTLACYESATFNTTLCSWDVTGTQPTMPTLACYQNATFNTNTCQWDVTGTQPTMPTLACYQTATFNTNTCEWGVTGTQPTMPTLACYQNATFNTNTCQWDVTGTPPTMPTLACYQTATINSSTCTWDVTGTEHEVENFQPRQSICGDFELKFTDPMGTITQEAAESYLSCSSNGGAYTLNFSPGMVNPCQFSSFEAHMQNLTPGYTYTFTFAQPGYPVKTFSFTYGSVTGAEIVNVGFSTPYSWD